MGRRLGRDGAELASHLPGRGEASGGVLGEPAREEPLERRRHRGAQRTRQRWGRVDHRVEEREDLLGVEGRLPGRHDEEHDGQRVEVGAPVDRPARELLGRRERRRADDEARLGLHHAGALHAGDAEVGDLEAPVGQHHDVARLDVAVHHARRVGRLERVAQHQAAGDDPLLRLRSLALEEVLERLALEPLHRHERDAALHARAVDGRDGGVRDGRGGARLLHEAPAQLVSARRVEATEELRAHRLDRDRAVEHRVAAAVDDAHRALPHLRLDAIREGRRGLGRRETKARFGGHGGPLRQGRRGRRAVGSERTRASRRAHRACAARARL